MDRAALNVILTEWNLESEYEKNQNLNRDDVETLRDFCESVATSAASNITDELVAAILHSNDYNLDRARTAASKYFEFRANSPEIFEDRLVDGGDIQFGLDILYFCPLPRKSPEGYRIIFQKMRRSDLRTFHHAAASKLQFLTMDLLIHEDPTCPGYIYLADLRGMSLGHVFKASFFLMRKLLKYMQEGIPIKIQRALFINAESLSEKMLRLVKPFIHRNMWDVMKFYTTEQMGEFWETFPKVCLPREYDGDLPDIETLHQNQIHWLRRLQPVVDIRSTRSRSYES